MIETNDDAAILFTCRVYVHTAPAGVRQLVGAMTHISDHERYRWLNNVICPVTGVVEPRADEHGSEVVLEISQLIWEPPRRVGQASIHACAPVKTSRWTRRNRNPNRW